MSLSFQNAPLVELIAELRWNVPSGVGLQSAVMGNQPTPPHFLAVVQPHAIENFLMRVGGEVYQRGYRSAERLVPPGVPIMLHQVVSRYRGSEPGKTSTMYQAGVGVFTANAVPPYRNWDEFAPIVSDGVKALLAAREPEGALPPFTSVSLRYINAFRETLTQAHDISSFLSDVLGFEVQMPAAISGKIKAGERAKPTVQLAVPLTNGMQLNIGAGEGLVNNERGLLMELSVSAAGAVPADHSSLMDVMVAAHQVIHDVFVEITKPIHKLMKPSEKE